MNTGRRKFRRSLFVQRFNSILAQVLQYRRVLNFSSQMYTKLGTTIIRVIKNSCSPPPCLHDEFKPASLHFTPSTLAFFEWKRSLTTRRIVQFNKRILNEKPPNSSPRFAPPMRRQEVPSLLPSFLLSRASSRLTCGQGDIELLNSWTRAGVTSARCVD